MLKGVLFDMDGVIVDTEPLHHKAYHLMFDDVEIEVTPELYQSFTGQSTLNICKRLCDHFGVTETPETLVQLKRKHFKHIFANDPSLQLIDGVLDIIKEYHERELKLVLASSASMMTINNIFDRFDLNQYFIEKFSGADLQQSKPHPEIFEKAAFSTGYERSQCMVIEDSTNGIKAANAAKIFCVGYDSVHSKNQDYSIANHVISDFSEIQHDKMQAIFKGK
ncbi:HAD family phosphatase [Kordia sp. YSTF-M3]|uniref:HAD family phosphatase n=1 Tax=Kordia aestuariivivens TaxID=2759037 RepID=A0ABR7QCU0_9FLAO|nr:HAD family phosphatase [Kordia aestuariivivens]MBC8756392.1 HAD family phosphatase [Kordia aestuariivivens]